MPPSNSSPLERALRDSPEPPHEHRSGDAQELSPHLSWPVVVLCFTILGLIRFASFELDDLARAVHGNVLRRVLEETTGAYAALLLFPLLVLLERRYPLSAGRWRSHWAAHVAGFVAYSLVHTTLLALSRRLLSPMLGLGPYSYGQLSMRYPMEAATDLLAYIIFAGALTGIRLQHELRQREVRAAALERDAATARLEALSARLQPHFLFNALNTISSTVYEDPIAADEMIGRLGDLLRHALRTTERQEVSVEEELGLLRAYLTFVDARFGDRVSVDIEVDPTTLDIAVPTLLLQPLVENAVRHGAAREFGEARVLLSISRTDGDLLLVVENDVSAPSPSRAQQQPHSHYKEHERAAEPERVGTGIATSRDRLLLLHGPFASLETTRADGRFRVTIRLPARPADDAVRSVPTEEHARAHR